eukprot:scaffold178607_cov51-Cyclotella_meneghiniana.AAC.2
MATTTTDWVYFSEGGKHAIFTHRDHALRVEKGPLVRAARAALDQPSSTRSNLHLLEDIDESSSSARFRELIIKPNLGDCYIDAPREVFLPPSFCSKLYVDALSSGNIPPSRLTSWQGKENINSDDIIQSGVNATLLRNYTRLKCQSSKCTNKSPNPVVVSVEIKPKAGYLTNSPLVLSEHRCKYYRSRYDLQQELMDKNLVKKGWYQSKGTEENRHNFRRSNYSPLDLFSGDFTKLKASVKELSRNMQNNFRVWCNGKILRENDIPSMIYNDILNNLLCGMQQYNPSKSDARSNILDMVVCVVTNVLHREKLLERLLSLQSLDVIDGDGAILVYKRLVDLFGGSQSEAEAALKKIFIPSGDEALSRCSLNKSCQDKILSTSPYPMPHCPHLHELLNEIESFQSYLDRQRQSGFPVDSSIENKCHLLCNNHVTQLSKESCIFLLSNWLLSLTMCDVSFFVTFTLLYVADIDKIEETVLDDDGRGVFICNWDNALNLPKSVVQYEVNAIDYDPKPVEKLRNRNDVEKLFQYCDCVQ